MGGRQEDPAGRVDGPDDVAGGGSAEDAVVADDELLDTVGGADLCNQLQHLWVPVPAIAADDEGGVLGALGDGEEDGGDEGLCVVWLLEDLDLFAEAGPVDAVG